MERRCRRKIELNSCYCLMLYIRWQVTMIIFARILCGAGLTEPCINNTLATATMSFQRALEGPKGPKCASAAES